MSDILNVARLSQRRQVTVLFLDIAGSTLMTRQLDAEDVLEVMDTALRRFSQIVTAQGGRVLQYAGDSVLAAFGAERALEDDPERAVRAGLDLLAAAREHAVLVQREHGLAGFGIRVGIHTGEVLLGGGVDDDGTIRGYTVNIAARLEQSAPAGAVRISQETWRQVRGVFEAEAQPPLQVKGQDEPLLTYLVSGLRPRAFRALGRGVDGLETAFVGRQDELASLLGAFERTATGGGLQAVTLLAEAGLGKSRLLHEFQLGLDASERSCWLLRGRAQPASQHQPYGLLRDVLAWRLQIADSDRGDAARERLVQGLLPFFAADGDEAALRQAELLGQLIGMDFSASPRLAAMLRDARLLRDGALAAFATWLQRLAASDGSSVVLLLDDLQWADDASLDLLEQVRTRTELPLLLVLAARPTLLERRPNWGQGWERHQAVTLVPLPAAGRRALLQSLLQRVDDVPPALLTLIDDQAEGIPYYAEELVQMLIDVGVIDNSVSDPGAERWQVRPERLAAAHVPGTLVGVLQARLDALAANERRAIQAASIVGPVFWDDALQSLDHGATDMLPELQRKAMVQARAESAFEGTREEAFNHHLLHQVTYDTLLKAERRAGHVQAAQWLASRVGDRMAEYLALTAEHYERAGDTARAIDWLERAALSAQQRFANSMALSIFARLLAMPELAADPRRRSALLGHQTDVADLIGDRALHATALDTRWQLAEALDDDVLRAGTLCGKALLADRTGQLNEAQGYAERAAVLAERSDNAATAAVALGELGWVHVSYGRIDEAEAAFRDGLRWAREAGLRMKEPHHDQYEPMLQTMLATALIEKHDYEGALTALHAGLALAQERHRPRVVCGCHDWLGVVALKVFDLPMARAHAQALAEVAQQIGSLVMIATAPMKQAELALLEGRYGEAAALARAGAAEMERVGAIQQSGHALLIAGAAHAANGEHALARELHQRSHDAYERVGVEDAMRQNRLAIAEAWRAEGDLARALALLEPEMAVLDAPDAVAARACGPDAHMNAWRVFEAAADSRAARQLKLAHDGLQRFVAHISDPLVRERMVTFSPLHREAAAAWAAHQQQRAN